MLLLSKINEENAILKKDIIRKEYAKKRQELSAAQFVEESLNRDVSNL